MEATTFNLEDVDSPETISPAKLTPELRKMLRENCERSLYFLTKWVLGYHDLVTHIHLPICMLLEDEEIRSLKSCLPRGWFKSTIHTIAYPIWKAIKKKGDLRLLVVQNTYLNATKKLAEIAGHWEHNDLLRALYPELLPGPNERWSQNCLTLKRPKIHAEGTFEAAGTDTKLTSRHYDEIIEDDTVSPDLDDMNAETVTPSEQDIEQAIGFHKNVSPLFVKSSVGRNIVVGTRWAQRDLQSYIQLNERWFYSYERSCRETNGISDPKGEVTFPERFPLEELDKLLAKLGWYLYSCLYLNNPLRSEDMIFQRRWFTYYQQVPPRTQLMTYCTVDLANDPKKRKSGGRPDFNVVMVTGKDIENGDVYVLDYWRARTHPGDVITNILKMWATWKFPLCGIESVGYQESIQYWLSERMRKERLYFGVEGITQGNISKELRIRGLQPLFEDRKVHVMTWMEPLLTELEAFPLGANDDLADALAMGKKFWMATISKKEKKEKDGESDPLSFAAAEKELRDRFKPVDSSNSLSLLALRDDRGRYLDRLTYRN